MTKLYVACITAAAAISAAPMAQAQQASGIGGGKILIGQSAPLSGSNAQLGIEIREGALAYFKKVNEAGGVYGRRIELVTLDDANDVPRAEANTRELVEKTGVFALFGYASATLSRPALPIVEKHRVPFLAPFTGAEPMRAFNRYVYNMRASYADELQRIIGHFATVGITRFAVVHYDDAVGKENLNVVERALKERGLFLVSTAALKDRANPDIQGGLKQVRQGNPEVVVFTTLYKATADFVKVARQENLGAQMVSNSFPGSTALAKELGPMGAGVGVTQVVPPPSRRSVPVVQEYQSAMEKLGKSEFSVTSLESYIAAKVMVEALRRAGPKVTRESLIQALDGLRYDTGGYIVAFAPSNHNGSSYVELAVMSKDGRFNY